MQKLRYSSMVDASPWPDREMVVRKSDFVEEKLNEHSEILDDCSFISENKVWEVYDEHLQGKNNYKDIFSILTFLENEITHKTLR